MPYMRVSLSVKLTEEQRQSLYEKLGEALRHIPGKEPFMLIAEIEDGRPFYAFGKSRRILLLWTHAISAARNTMPSGISRRL